MKILTVAYRNLRSIDKDQLEKTKSWGRCLVVHQDADAAAVAADAELQQALIIVVVDAYGAIQGVVTPPAVIERAGREGGPARDLVEAVEALEKIFPNRTDYESLNTVRPKMVWCDPGSHLTSEDPCSEHQKSSSSA